MYLATLVWPTSMPSLCSSPWIRGAPQSGLARLMSRISRRISSGTLGLPPRCLDFQRQNDRNPAQCQRTTVSGRISASSRTLERNRLVSAVHSSMRTSTIGHKHHPIRPAGQPYRVSDKDRERISSRQIRFTASRTPVSGRTVMDMVGIGMEFGPRSKRKRARRVARMMCACIIAKFAPTQTRGPAPNGR